MSYRKTTKGPKMTINSRKMCKSSQIKQKKVQNHKNEQRRQEMVPKGRETCRVTQNDYRKT